MPAPLFLRSLAPIWIVLLAFLFASDARASSECLTAEGNRFCFDDEGRFTSFNFLDKVSIPVHDNGFVLSLNGRVIQSTNLHPSMHLRTGTTLLYRFSTGEFRIDLVYEIKPTWAFVSKRIRIFDQAHRDFEVDSVSPIALELGVPSETFVAHPSFPQFTKATAVKQPADLAGLATYEQVRFLRFSPHSSLLVTVQNPLSAATPSERGFRLEYRPALRWPYRLRAFESDRALIGIASLTGHRLPSQMSPEWTPTEGGRDDGADEGEVAAMTKCVRAFLQTGTVGTTRNVIGWTLNDYQIDASTQKGREQYKRVFAAAAKVHADNVLYGPANSALGSREEDVDEAHWEHVTWLGLGPSIRMNHWNMAIDPLPVSVSNALADARTRHLKLLAYVFPTLQLYRRAGIASDVENVTEGKAVLASFSYQDRLVRDLLMFKRRTGLAGYSFDFISLTEPGASPYAQWFGFRRLMRALRAESPDIVLDGRQWYQLYGPWSWLSGTYPHPLGTDEQPESFRPFPDLHFDRVSADRQRYVAYWYRNYQFCPEEILPGYMTHQTPRKRGEGKGELVLSDFRLRDWDSLGWKYSVLSSIATGAWHSVINYLPARDAADAKMFSSDDAAWFRGWLTFARAHRELLKHTKTILGQPALGQADGTAAIANDAGYLFLFNPNYKPVEISLTLDASCGFTGFPGTPITIKNLGAGNAVSPTPASSTRWQLGDRLQISLPASSASVLTVSPRATRKAWMWHASVAARSGKDPFSPEIPLRASEHRSDRLIGEFIVPEWLRKRLRSAPADLPSTTKNDAAATPWLGSNRLLLYLPVEGSGRETRPRLSIDGLSVEFTPAYTSLRVFPEAFLGWWVDVTSYADGHTHTATLSFDGGIPNSFQGLFIDGPSLVDAPVAPR